MDTIQLLKGVEVFDGLSDAELKRIAGICQEALYQKGDRITTQGEAGDEMFIIREGFVEISVGEADPSTAPLRGSAQASPEQSRRDAPPPHALVSLGMGQVVGEMALVDHGPRSATARCMMDQTMVIVIKREAFEQLCQSDHRIGMIVYRNLAADLSFKLRHRHLTRR
jgi:CRP/FNR family transcriptional regulator, cyclic AMP receptor protein